MTGRQLWLKVARLWSGPANEETSAGLCYTLWRLLGMDAGDETPEKRQRQYLLMCRKMEKAKKAGKLARHGVDHYGTFYFPEGKNRAERAKIARYMASTYPVRKRQAA